YVFRDVNAFRSEETAFDRVLTKYLAEAHRGRREIASGESGMTFGDGLALAHLARKIQNLLDVNFSASARDRLNDELNKINPEVRVHDVRKRLESGLLSQINALIAARQIARDEKNFEEADRIRQRLDALRIVLKDVKTSSGESLMTWMPKP